SEQANEQEIDLLRHQIQEIGNAAPEPEEVATLEQRYQRASNRTRLLSLAGDILQRLEGGDQSILNQLRETQRLIRDLEQGDPQCSRWTGEFDSAQVELEELARSLNDYAGDLEINPKEHARLEERINTLETLKRKYGQTIEEILAFKEKAATRLAKIEGRDEAIEQLAGYVKKALRKGQSAGTKLPQKRRGAAPKLAKLICRHLKDLGFRQARIDIDLIPHDAPGSLGMETVDFIFAPNPGEPSKPLRVIASSGEMSRVMLAVKSALARQDAIPLLVFDEIDANVGGEIARAVGVKMAELGNAHQVIAITHLPQVAALAGSHFVVRKDFDDDRTRSTLTEVSTKDRVSEISRMLGGNEKSALAHARSLLKEAS
ncbi:MAG: DNA repair protein RecN, partial [Verrucomicrobiota bacterium]